jgi:hypothetical protein
MVTDIKDSSVGKEYPDGLLFSKTNQNKTKQKYDKYLSAARFEVC